MPVQNSASASAASHCLSGGFTAGQAQQAGNASTSAADTWLPVATASGSAPAR